jgi:hypothetical protein
MMLSRLACILIRVYAPQVAADQPAATARHGRRRPPRRGAPVPRPALVRLSQLTAPGGLATFAGNLNGMVGTYLAQLMVLLVSRIPFTEQVASAGPCVSWRGRRWSPGTAPPSPPRSSASWRS